MSQFNLHHNRRFYQVEYDDFDGCVISIHEKRNRRLVFLDDPPQDVASIAETHAARLFVAVNENESP